MTKDSIRRFDRRVGKLELRFGPLIEALSRRADPFSMEAVFMRLAAGEWERALKLLEHQRCDICRSRPLDLNVMASIDFTNSAGLFRKIDRALARLPQETRTLIAARLLAADTDSNERDHMERSPPRDQLVRDHAEGVNVTLPARPAEELFRRHITRGAGNHGQLRQRRSKPTQDQVGRGSSATTCS